MKYKGLIFDFNGVLLLDQELHDEIWKKYAKKISGKNVTDEEIEKKFHSRTNKGVLEYIFDKKLDPEDVEHYASEKESIYRDRARDLGSTYHLAPGASELLDELKQRGIFFTIATSSPKVNVDFFNERLHLDTWFDMSKVVGDDGRFPGKPAPDIYLHAAQLLALRPEECVVIEDARSGIAAAHAAGIGHIIAIGPKERHIELRAIEGVDEVIERLSEVDITALFE